MKPPARPFKPPAVWGVGVASSRLRCCESGPLSAEAKDELVAKEEFVVVWPKIELCCCGVLPHDGSVEPLFEPTVTVDPKLCSVLGAGALFDAPPKADFCCPSPANPD